jgi:hypothetical protein
MPTTPQISKADLWLKRVLLGILLGLVFVLSSLGIVFFT